jgi:hypothetical protein
MPIPLIFKGPESKYTLAARNGDYASVKTFLQPNVINDIDLTEHARALLAAIAENKCEVARKIFKKTYSKLNLNQNDIDLILYPALRTANANLLAKMCSKSLFATRVNHIQANDNIIAILQNMLILNRRTQLLEILRALWPQAAADQPGYKFPEAILQNAELAPILPLLSVQNMMIQSTQGKLCKDLSDLIFSYVYRMEPIGTVSKRQAKYKHL